ncbi:MAG TPA: hypothetical protein VG248_00965 [Caulobacteraceae bacterium]|nr:hypothetical protein [Caulobacteraceae bacterium]
MPRRRPRPPATPTQIAIRRAAERASAADPASWGVDAKALRLPANAQVERQLAGRERVVRARRLDVFDNLARHGGLNPLALGAVRRLQQDVARLHHTLGSGRMAEPKVDGGADCQGFADSHAQAGARIAAVLERAGPASARLLDALIEAETVLGRPADWRAVVQRETGERLADAQAAALRAACENLAGAYRRLDREGPPR